MIIQFTLFFFWNFGSSNQFTLLKIESKFVCYINGYEMTEIMFGGLNVKSAPYWQLANLCVWGQFIILLSREQKKISEYIRKVNKNVKMTQKSKLAD